MNGSDDKKVYHAMFWAPDPTVPGKRVQVYAVNAEEARKLLQAEYGTENTYSIWNEEEANQPR